MEKSFISKLYDAHQQCVTCPSPGQVANFYIELLGTLFPDFSTMSFNSKEEFELHFQKLRIQLDQLLFRDKSQDIQGVDKVANEFFDKLPVIHSKLLADVNAMFEGDPAAKSTGEVVRTYPGFYAIAAYRIAHALYQLSVQD